MPKKSNALVPISEPDWETQRDLETLLEAERIERDPKRLAKAKKLAQQRLIQLAGVASEGPKDGS